MSDKTTATDKREATSGPVSKETAFGKEQLISAKRYAGKRDALTVLLSDDKMYTLSETDKILKDFMKGKVN